jgi:hypothetical protein
MAEKCGDMKYVGPVHNQDTDGGDYLRVKKSTVFRFGALGILAVLIVAASVAIMRMSSAYLHSELEACRAGIEILEE